MARTQGVWLFGEGMSLVMISVFLCSSKTSSCLMQQRICD